MVFFSLRKLFFSLLLVGVIGTIAFGQPEAVTCINDVNISLDQSCEIRVTAELVASGPAPAGSTVTLEDHHGNPITGDVLDYNYVGQQVKFRLTEPGGNSCWGYITLEDKLAPIFNCVGQDIDNPVVVPCQSMDAHFPQATDNCDHNVTVTLIHEEPVSEQCDADYIKKVKRVFLAEDDFGNTSVCTTYVRVQKLIFDDIMIPMDLVDDNAIACDMFVPVEFSECIPDPDNEHAGCFPKPARGAGDPADFSYTGVPYIMVNGDKIALYPDFNADCGFIASFCDELIADFGCTKKIVRTWTIVDNCTGAPRYFTDQQSIHVTDTVAPVILAPEEMFVSGSASDCTAEVSLPIPTITDNCETQDEIRLDIMYDLGYISFYKGEPVALTPGPNLIKYIAIDDCGNTDTVEVYVFVEDNFGPNLPACDDKVISIPQTGFVHVHAEVFAVEEVFDCSGIQLELVRRTNPGCGCEDEVPVFSGFTYLGERPDGHRYFISDDSLTAPHAFSLAASMGGHVVVINNNGERLFVSNAVRGLPNGAVDYIIGYTDREIEGVVVPDISKGNFSFFPDNDLNNAQNDYVMTRGFNDNWVFYDGRIIEKQFVLEIAEPCGWSENISFCCEDLATPEVMVQYKAIDKWGNGTECMVNIELQDKVAPIINCPEDATILCTENISLDTTYLRERFGFPTVFDQCTNNIIELEPIDNRNICGFGDIVRTFIISDPRSTTECTQVISVDTINNPDIRFFAPEEIKIDTCEEGIVVDTADVDAQFIPTITGGSECDTYKLIFEDRGPFQVSGGSVNSCFKVLRTWRVISNCFGDTIAFNLGNTNEIATEYVQSIVVENTVGPNVTLSPTTDMMVVSDNCEGAGVRLIARGRDDCTEDGDLLWEYHINLFSDSTSDIDFSQSGSGRVSNATNALTGNVYPIGMHTITWTYFDRCGNSTTLAYDFQVKLGVGPIAVCQNLAMPLHEFDTDGDGVKDSVKVCANASMFNNIKSGSYHPCEADFTLSFSEDPLDTIMCFDCSSLCDLQVVTIFVIDEFGNVSSCDASLEIQDPKGLCNLPTGCINRGDSNFTPTSCVTDYSPGNLETLGFESPSVDMTCCDDFNIISTDVMSTNGDGCDVITRTWNIITNCGCGEQSTFVQTITVLDNEAPVLNCPGTGPNGFLDIVMTGPNATQCGAQVDFEIPTITSMCSSNVTITHNSTNASNPNGPDASGFYPFGNTFVDFTAVDACGNVSTCRVTVRVRDNTPPVCNELTGIEVQLGQMIDLSMLGSFTDNCGVESSVITPPMFDCGDVDANSQQTVSVTVTDVNGNVVVCDIPITVVDNLTPFCVSQDFTVSLNANGMATVSVNDLDNGSMVGCNVPNLSPPNFTFDCDDMGVNTVAYTISFQGVSLMCTADVTVLDSGTPMLQCPADRTLSCLSDLSDLNDYGMATVTGASCPPMITELAPMNNLTACGGGMIGTLTRTFMLNGTMTCTQVLTLEAQNPFTMANFVDQPDTTINTCNFQPGDIIPGFHPTYQGLGSLDCFDVPDNLSTISFEDEMLNSTQAFCERYRRIWTIMDACTGQTFIRNSIININDDQAPVLAAVGFNDNMITVPAADGLCESEDVQFRIGVVDSCTSVQDMVITTDPPGLNITNIDNNSFDIIDVFDAGLTTVTVSVMDDCGNTTDIVVDIIVTLDASQQEFRCKKIVRNVTDDGTVTVNINEIVCITGVVCDSGGGLTAAFSENPNDTTMTFTCADRGDIDMVFSIFNNGEFFRNCFAILTIGDRCGFCIGLNPNCNPNPGFDNPVVVGMVTTEEGEGVGSTAISLIGSEFESEMTDDQGEYAFPPMEAGSNYTVKPEKNTDFLNGLSTLDLILIQKHILGLATLDSPYKIIAADVNNSKTISATDLIELRKLILGQIDKFGNNTSWRMIDKKYRFGDPTMPLNENFPEDYYIDEFTEDMIIDFIGVKVGDVNISADPENFTSIETRTSIDVLHLDIEVVENENERSYRFYASDFADIQGFQYSLNFDQEGLSYQGINKGLLNISEENHLGLYDLNKGVIRFSYDHSEPVYGSSEEPLFTVNFTKFTNELVQEISINSTVISAEAYSFTNEVMNVNAQVLEDLHNIRLYQNSPNPWAESTKIAFNFPAQMEYEINIYDVTGSLVYKTSSFGSKGLNEVEILKSDVPSKGILYYELVTSQDRISKRMMLID